MGTLYFIMGKSSTGKDSIYNKLLAMEELNLNRVVGYTTRPIRSGEEEGRDYYFCTAEKRDKLLKDGKVIEMRTYPTVHGDWYYFTVDDGQIDFTDKDMLMIGTLESYDMVRSYFKDEKIVPIYIEVEDGVRLQRALNREKVQKTPRYEELCRRFLADGEDFSEEKLKASGIESSFMNEDVDTTTNEIAKIILNQKG